MANENDPNESRREEEKGRDERTQPSQSDRQQGGPKGPAGDNETTLSERSGPSSDEPSSPPHHQQGAMGGSVTAAGGGSEGPGAGSAGTEPGSQQSGEGGFVGSQEEDSGEYLQQDRRDQPNQGGFAEQGRGAAEGSGPEGTGERDANRDSDIEGSSKS